MFKQFFGSAVLLASILSASVCSADIADLSPSVAVLAPADGGDTTRVVILFDLSTLRDGSGRQIDQAVLTWTQSAMDTSATATFTIRAITTSWSAEGIAAGTESVSVDSEDLDLWEIQPGSLDPEGNALVRLELRDLVSDWAAEEASNHGVMLLTPSVGRSALQSHIPEMRLKIWYGFGDPQSGE